MLSKCDYLREKRPGRAGGAMGFIVLLQAERIGKGVSQRGARDVAVRTVCRVWLWRCPLQAELLQLQPGNNV